MQRKPGKEVKSDKNPKKRPSFKIKNIFKKRKKVSAQSESPTITDATPLLIDTNKQLAAGPTQAIFLV